MQFKKNRTIFFAFLLNKFSVFNKYEYLFIILVITFILRTTWSGLWQPPYWDSAHALFIEARQTAVDLNLFNYQTKSSLEPRPKSQIFFEPYSDYPHTFLTKVIYSLVIGLFPDNYFLPSHIVSLVISISLLILCYLFVRSTATQFEATVFTILLVTNPLFLAQTTLMYMEIPGLLFKLLSLYFLYNKKYLSFSITAITAFLTRFENAIILFIISGIWFFYFLKSDLNFKQRKELFFKFSFPILLSCIGWLVLFYYYNSFFINPTFNYTHTINRFETFREIFTFLFISQGRGAITAIFLIMTLITWSYSKHNKHRTFTIFLLFSQAFLTFLIILFLGNALMRYVLPMLIVYYYCFAYSLKIVKEKYKQSLINMIIFIIFAAMIQISYLYSCSGNYETCLNFIPHLNFKREISHLIEEKIPKDEIVFVGWDEEEELRNGEFSNYWYCSTCSQVERFEKYYTHGYDKLNTNSYLLVSDYYYKIFGVSDKKDELVLIKEFYNEKMVYRLYLFNK